MDYYVNLDTFFLTVPAGTVGYFTTCFDLTVIGDNTFEMDDLIPLSEQDSVVFPEGFDN